MQAFHPASLERKEGRWFTKKKTRPLYATTRLLEQKTLDYPVGSSNLGLTEQGGNEFYLPPDGALVYRLGHGPLKAERRVQFPCALPLLLCGLPAGLPSAIRFILLKRRRKTADCSGFLLQRVLLCFHRNLDFTVPWISFPTKSHEADHSTVLCRVQTVAASQAATMQLHRLGQAVVRLQISSEGLLGRDRSPSGPAP